MAIEEDIGDDPSIETTSPTASKTPEISKRAQWKTAQKAALEMEKKKKFLLKLKKMNADADYELTTATIQVDGDQDGGESLVVVIESENGDDDSVSENTSFVSSVVKLIQYMMDVLFK